MEDEELYEHHRLVVDKGQSPMRIDKFLTEKIQNATRNRVQSGLDTGNIRVNNLPVKPSYKIKPGDVITVLLASPPRSEEIIGENIPLHIVYEDESLAIINKPPGMVVHPAYGNWSGTLVNALVYHFSKLPTGKNGPIRPGLVHRIDKDTSGLMVIAKTEIAMSRLAAQFFEHSIDRIYHAMVWGVPKQESGTIHNLLSRNPQDRRMTAVTTNIDIGKEAITHYKVLRQFQYVSLIECKLETGRTHQIRAHMKHLGHPLFNDAMYGGDKILKGTITTKYKQFIENCFEIMPRQALHAKTLGFVHPDTREHMHFDSTYPPDMEGLILKWERFTNNN